MSPNSPTKNVKLKVIQFMLIRVVLLVLFYLFKIIMCTHCQGCMILFDLLIVYHAFYWHFHVGNFFFSQLFLCYGFFFSYAQKFCCSVFFLMAHNTTCRKCFFFMFHLLRFLLFLGVHHHYNCLQRLYFGT